jgi:chaperonin GroES
MSQGGVMKIRPLQDRILVERIEEEVKKGGIIIPDSAKEKPQQGKVIAAGPGRVDEKGNRIPMEVKKGDTILFGKYSGNEIRVGEDEHLIMREDDVLAVIEKEGK